MIIVTLIRLVVTITLGSWWQSLLFYHDNNHNSNISYRLAYLTACNKFSCHPLIALTSHPRNNQSPDHSSKTITNCQSKNRSDNLYQKIKPDMREVLVPRTSLWGRLKGEHMSTPMFTPDKCKNPLEWVTLHSTTKSFAWTKAELSPPSWDELLPLFIKIYQEDITPFNYWVIHMNSNAELSPISWDIAPPIYRLSQLLKPANRAYKSIV